MLDVRNWSFVSLLCLLCMLAGCATPTKSNKSFTVYDLRGLARLDSSQPAMRQAQKLVDIEARIENAAGIHVDRFVLAATDEINASALVKDGKSWLLIHRPVLYLLAEDDDALAGLIGHEVAHLALGHAASRQNFDQAVGAGSQVLGVLASLAVPGGGYLVGMGGNAIAKAYSRDQEREADKAGLDYMIKAGYQPAGMLRLFAILPVGPGGGASGFFDSHPGKNERLAYIRDLIRQK